NPSVTPTGAGDHEFFSVPMRATAAGNLVFATDPADDLPKDDVLLYNVNVPIPHEQVRYDSLAITVTGTFNAADDTFNGTEDASSNSLTPLTNDTNIGSNTNTLTISAVGTTDHGGVVTINSDNKTLKYTPAANFNGTEKFTYTAKNQNGEEHTATITMQVADVNDPPVATADTFNVTRGSAATPLT